MNQNNLLSIVLVVIFYTCTSISAQKDSISCIQQKIDEFKKQPVTNPPMSVYQYNYKNSIVYYISAPCCDRYTTLYNENCNIICRPNGGIIGKGDGKCRDFFEKRNDQILLWKDIRKSE